MVIRQSGCPVHFVINTKLLAPQLQTTKSLNHSTNQPLNYFRHPVKTFIFKRF
jgi:hypothetical protein